MGVIVNFPTKEEIVKLPDVTNDIRLHNFDISSREFTSDSLTLLVKRNSLQIEVQSVRSDRIVLQLSRCNISRSAGIVCFPLFSAPHCPGGLPKLSY